MSLLKFLVREVLVNSLLPLTNPLYLLFCPITKPLPLGAPSTTGSLYTARENSSFPPLSEGCQWWRPVRLALTVALGLGLALGLILLVSALSGEARAGPEPLHPLPPDVRRQLFDDAHHKPQTARLHPAQEMGAQQDGGRIWRTERVDAPKWFRYMTDRSLALDGNGNPHIAYGADHLYYAWYDGGQWHRETVDASYGVGRYAAIALAPTAPYTPHISYYDATNEALKHAWWTPSGWLSETVDSVGRVGEYTSLALAPTAPYTPHISYYDRINGALKHAWWTPSGWLSETVDSVGRVGEYTSLALEPTAPYTPHISYFDWTNHNLKHAWWTPSGWLSEMVDSSGDVGEYTSLALEPTAPYIPHISYYDWTNRDLKHAWLTVVEWVVYLPTVLRNYPS
jgi:hypothetical protein